jgi:prepilin peptidase CpaA
MNPPVAILVGLIVVIAAVIDIRSRRIPNWLTLSGIILGFSLNAVLAYPFSLEGLKNAGLGMLFAFGVYFVLYLIRAMGAGDVKLMAAVGAIMASPAVWFRLFIVVALIGGIFALALVMAKGRLRKTVWNVAFMVNELGHARAPFMTREELDVKNPKAVTLPHGFTIAVGYFLFLALSLLVK